MRSTLLAFAAIISAIFSSPSQAAPLVIQGVTATASSWWEMPNLSYQHPSNLVNNRGLSVPYDITATHAPHGDADEQWHARAWTDDPNPVLTFNLGAACDLDRIYIWNGNQGRVGQDNTGRGVNSFTVSVSKNGSTFTEAFTGNLTRSPFSINNVGPISAQNFNLAGHVGITHVRIRVNSIHDPANPYPALSEVMFTATPVPELFKLSRMELGANRVTLVFPSEPGQVFDVFRSVDLKTGFDIPFVANLPATLGSVVAQGEIDSFFGGITLGDSDVNFGTTLTAGKTYSFIPSDGLKAGMRLAVVSWSGNDVTLAEDIAADLSWTGGYRIESTAPAETEWIDTNPPPGRAFYKVRRR